MDVGKKAKKQDGKMNLLSQINMEVGVIDYCWENL